jgi:hypothetical protein
MNSCSLLTAHRFSPFAKTALWRVLSPKRGSRAGIAVTDSYNYVNGENSAYSTRIVGVVSHYPLSTIHYPLAGGAPCRP